MFVVTTATCITRSTNGFKLTSVRLGEWDKSTHIDCENLDGVWVCNNAPIDVPIEKIVLHRQFGETGDINDNIGLIHLKHKVKFTDFVKPICVSGFVFMRSLYEELYIGRQFEIASWGDLFPIRKKTEILLKVDLAGIPCPSDSGYICMRGTRKRNVCNEDDGAPIMGRATLGNRSYAFLAGLVSPINSCGAAEGPISFVPIKQLLLLLK